MVAKAVFVHILQYIDFILRSVYMDDYNNYPQEYNDLNDSMMYDEDMDTMFSARYNRFNNRFNNRYNNYYNYDRRYDPYFDRRGNYYNYPYCDRYGRCSNPLWWMFWPMFFL